MKSCENCHHFIKGELIFSMCGRTAFTDPEDGMTKHVPIMMERYALPGCCGPDAKFFEPVNKPKEQNAFLD